MKKQFNYTKIVNLYKSGKSTTEIASEINCHHSTVHRILKEKNVKTRTLSESIRLSKRNSKYFIPSEIPKPPLTKYVKSLVRKGLKKDFDKLIAVFELTDGDIYLRKKYTFIKFSGRNKILHEILVDLIYFKYKILPSSYLCKGDGVFVTIYSRKDAEKLLNDLLNLSPSYKTHPKKEAISEYLSKPQPTLKFLFNSTKEIQCEAFRIGMSTEGDITAAPMRHTVGAKIRLACSHPTLAKQWQKIAEELNMKLKIEKRKITWSGISSIYSTSNVDVGTFLKLGGFLNGVRISKHSKYYTNLEKNDVLKAIFEVRRKMVNGKIRLRNPNHPEVNKVVKKVALQISKGNLKPKINELVKVSKNIQYIKFPKIDTESVKEFIRLYHKGHSTYIIGKKFKISHPTVRRYLIRNGVKLRSISETNRLRNRIKDV